MDIQMPRMDGLEATRILCSAPNKPKVIVLTMFDLDEYVYEALSAGAAGFLLTNSPPTEVLHAIRVAHEGNALLAPEVTERLIGRLAPQARPDPRTTRLTTRERETLTLTLIGEGALNGAHRLRSRDRWLTPPQLTYRPVAWSIASKRHGQDPLTARPRVD